MLTKESAASHRPFGPRNLSAREMLDTAQEDTKCPKTYGNQGEYMKMKVTQKAVLRNTHNRCATWPNS